MKEITYKAMRKGIRTEARKNNGTAKIGPFSYRDSTDQMFYQSTEDIPILLDWKTVNASPQIQGDLEKELTHIAIYAASAISEDAQAFSDRLSRIEKDFKELWDELQKIGHRIQKSNDNKFSIIRDSGSPATTEVETQAETSNDTNGDSEDE